MKISFVNVPMNMGCNRQGVELSGSYIREVFLRNNENIIDEGDIRCSNIIARNYNDKIKNITGILKVCSDLGDKVYDILNNNNFVIIYGGDHSLTWGSINGVVKKYGKDISVVYIDAHGDFNTLSTSPTGNVHGMHMAYLMGYGEEKYVDFYSKGRKINSDNVIFCATRSLDEGERILSEKEKFIIYSSEFINKNEECAIELIKNKVLEKKAPVHISFDIDSIDPRIAPGTGVPEKNGVTEKFAMALISELLLTTNVVSMDIVEFNPLLDEGRKTETIIKNLIDLVEGIVVKK